MSSTVQGQEYQHALIGLTIGAGGPPIVLVTFSAISWKVSAEKEEVPDSQGQPTSWVIKQQKNQSSLTLLRSEWVNKLRPGIAKQFPTLGTLQWQFDLDITYGNSVLNYQTDKMVGVMFQEDGFESKNDQSPLEITIPLFFMRINTNGIQPMVYRPY